MFFPGSGIADSRRARDGLCDGPVAGRKKASQPVVVVDKVVPTQPSAGRGMVETGERRSNGFPKDDRSACH
jgi:hypothetical protein